MAQLTITAADVGVASDSGHDLRVGQASQAVTEGEVVRWNPATQRFDKAANDTDDNAGSGTGGFIGVALTPASGPEAYFLYSHPGSTGRIKPGATVAPGRMYYLGQTPGKIVEFADLTSTDKVTEVFRGETTSEVSLVLNPTGIDVP